MPKAKAKAQQQPTVAGPLFFSNLERRAGKANTLAFDVDGVDVSVVNALRRTIPSSVPTVAFAFEDIAIAKNTSVLNNEFLAKRLALVPLHLTEDETAAVAGGAAAEFTLSLRNEGDAPLNVTSAHFASQTHGADLARIFPPDAVTGDHVLLCRLKPQEALDVSCKARVGTGREHAGFCPTSLCVFSNRRDHARADAALEAQIAEARAKNATEEELARLVSDFRALGAQRFFPVDGHGDPCAFRFSVDSECGLRPTFLVFKGLRILADRLTALAACLGPPGNEDDARVTVEPDLPGLTSFRIRGEDHTLGNLVQAMLHNRFVRDGAGAEVQFVGYHQPHPLEDVIMLRVRCAAPDVPAFLATALQGFAADVEALLESWVRLNGDALAGVAEVARFLESRTAPPGPEHVEKVAKKRVAAKAQAQA